MSLFEMVPLVRAIFLLHFYKNKRGGVQYGKLKNLCADEWRDH